MMPRPRRYRDVRASIRRRDRDVGVSNSALRCIAR